VALRQLDQQRAGRFGDRGQVVDGQQPGLVAGRPAGQAVQPLEGPVLVPVQVAQGVVHHRPALAAVGVHAQHRLLGHRAAGQVDGGRLAEQPGDLVLELGDHAPVAVAVRHRVRGDAGQQVSRTHRAMAGQEHGALVAQGGLLAEVGHGPIISWAGPRRLRYGPAMEDADGYFPERVAATYDDSSEGMFDSSFTDTVAEVLAGLPPGQNVVPWQVTPGQWAFDVYDTATQAMSSNYITLTDGRGEYRSIPFRYVWPSELDLM